MRHIAGKITIALVVILAAAHFLGMYLGLYASTSWWDMVMHSAWGVVGALAGGWFARVLLRRGGIELSRRAAGVFALYCFCFAITGGAVWEVSEYAADRLLGMNTQKSVYTHYSIGTEGFNEEAIDYFDKHVQFFDGLSSEYVDTNGSGEGDTLLPRTGRLMDTGLVDTMEDTVCNTAGAAIAAVGIYIYYKRSGGGETAPPNENRQG